MNRLIPMLVLTLIWFGHAVSQEQATGFPPYGSFQDGNFDAVNRQNLNVHFTLPLVALPGRGLDFKADINYDSLIWRRVGNVWLPVLDGNSVPTWGWKKDVPSGQISWVSEVVECGTKPYVSLHWYGYKFTDPGGTSHTFNLNFFGNPCGGATSPRTAPAADDSGYFIDATAPGNPIVYSPGGVTFQKDGKVTDTNGNFISRTVVSSSETDWTDTLGRTALKIIQNASSTDYQYQDTTGTYRTIRLNYSAKNIKTNFGCAGVGEYTSPSSVLLPSSLVLANGQSYSFSYETTPGFPGYVTGRILRVNLPSGGYYEYSYAGSNGGMNCADASLNGLTRILNDGSSSSTWTYSRADIGGGSWQTTVTAPQLPYDATPNVSLYTFDSNTRETQRKVFQGNNTAGTALIRVDTTYPTTNRTPLVQKSVLADGRQSQVTSTYDSYSLPTSVKEYNWGQGVVGTLFRTTSIGYVRATAYTSRLMTNLVSSISVSECAGVANCTIVHSQSTGYDSTTPMCVTGAVQHNDASFGCTFNTRGNATVSTEYIDPVAGTGPVTKTRAFDTLGNLRSADMDCCQQKAWGYSSSNQYAYPETETSGPAGGPQLVTTTTYNSHTGLVTAITDPNGRITSAAYDLTKRLTSITRPDLVQLTYSYADTVPISVAVSAPVDAISARRKVTRFDGLGRSVRETTTDVSGGIVYSNVDQIYDATGGSYKTSNPYTGAASHWTESRYDALGRTVLTIPPGGTPTSNTFSCTYAGVTRTETDPAGRQRRYEYDARGRLVIATEPDPSTGTLSWTTSYAYTGLDQVKTITQGAQSRTFTYDGLARLTSMTTPESGTESYLYNNFGLATQRTDARGVITTYQYDALNRLTQTAYNVGSTGVPQTATITYTYGTNSALNNNGRLITMTDGVGQESLSYDILGRVTQVSKSIAGVTYPIGYQYNAGSEITSITYPSGRQYQQSFDAIGRASTLSFNGANALSGVTYNAAQQATSYTFGNGIGAAAAYSSDRLQLTSLTYSKTGVSLPSFGFGYVQPNGGNNGQITQVTDNVSSGRTTTYTYDSLNRLSSAETVGSASYPKWKLAWTYDRYGNRLAQTATIGAAPSNNTTVSSSTNHVTSPGYGYDPAGNLTSLPGASMTFDAENRLKTYSGTSTATYAYDGWGLRRQKTVGATNTVYILSGDKVIAEYASGAPATTPLREYVYAGDRLVETLEGSPKYHLSDSLSMRATTDSSGNVTSEVGHYPFGENWYATNGGTKWGFTSYERDAESGFDYARARYYSPTIGRFLSGDPAGANASDPQSLARYSYARNDPIDLVDPSGRMMVCAWVATWTVTTVYDPVWGTTDTYTSLDNFSIDCYAFGGPGRRGGGGGGAAPPTPVDPCKDPKNSDKIDFLRNNKASADLLAQLIATKPEFLLAQSADESDYGRSDLARNGGNYFGLKYGSFFDNFRIGAYINPLDNQRYAKFDTATGFLDSGASIISDFHGRRIYGTQTINDYIRALTTQPMAFNSTKAYPKTLLNFFNEVMRLLPCI